MTFLKKKRKSGKWTNLINCFMLFRCLLKYQIAFSKNQKARINILTSLPSLRAQYTVHLMSLWINILIIKRLKMINNWRRIRCKIFGKDLAVKCGIIKTKSITWDKYYLASTNQEDLKMHFANWNTKNQKKRIQCFELMAKNQGSIGIES